MAHTQTATEVIMEARKNSIRVYRDHLAKLEAKENPSHVDQINMKVTREWLAAFEPTVKNS